MRLPNPNIPVIVLTLLALWVLLLLTEESRAAPTPQDQVYLHYDVAADPDDLQAIIAGKQLADKLNVSPKVIIGTHTYKSEPSSNQYRYLQSQANEIAQAMYGSDYRDVGYNHNGHDNSVAAEWDAVIQGGGRVYVAEGGPSDFTARVLQRMSTDTQQVTVVQHSVTWNEVNTEPSALAYVQQNTDYQVVQDGNGVNATAGFRELKTDDRIRQLTATNPAWQTAIDYHWEAVDFSDTVEFLHIMGVGTDQIRNVDDYVSYIGSGGSQSRCEARSITDLNQCLASGNDAYIVSDMSCSGSCIQHNTGTIYGGGYTITRNSGQKQGNLLRMQGSNLTVQDLTLDDGDGPTCTPNEECPRTVQMGGSNLTLNNVTVRNSKAYTIGVDNATDVTIQGIQLMDGGIVGLYIGTSNRVSVTGSRFNRVGSNSIAVLGGINVTITGNHFENNHRLGFWPVAPQFGEGLTGGGQVYIARGEDILFSNNTVINGSCDQCRGGVHGVEVSEPNKTSVYRLTIADNTINNHTGANIYVNQGATVIDSDLSNSETPVIEEPSVCYIRLMGGTYHEAYAAYSAVCDLPRIDCDYYEGSIVCASYRLNSSEDIRELLGTEPEPPVEEPVDEPTSCYTVSSTSVGFGGAYDEYAQVCSLPRVDCDRYNNSIVCASFRLDQSVIENLNLNLSESTEEESGPVATVYRTLPISEPSQSPGGISWADSFSYQNRCYIHSTFDHGAGDLLIGGQRARDIARIQNTPNTNLADAFYNDINCGNGPPNTAGDEHWCPGRVDLGTSGCRIAGPDIRNQL